MKVSGFKHEVHINLIFTGKDLRVLDECSNRNPLVESRNHSQPNGLIWKMVTILFFTEFGSTSGFAPVATKRHDMLANGELDNLILEQTLTVNDVKDLIKVVEYTTPFRHSSRNAELLHCQKLHTDLNAAINSAAFELNRCENR